MRKLVKSTLIMLPLLLLSTRIGNIPVASAYAARTSIQASIRSTQTVPILTLEFIPIANPSRSLCQLNGNTDFSLQPLKEPEIVLSDETIEPVIPEVASIQAVKPAESTVTEQASTITTITPTEIPLASVATPTPSAGSSGGLNAEVIFTMVNQERAKAGLPPFEKHPDLCAVTESRRPELENEIFGTSYIHAGFQARHLPYHATENMISQQTEQAAVTWWMNSSLHRSAVLGSTKHACVACQGNVCAMIFADL